MPVPWAQLVRLLPSILSLSKELADHAGRMGKDRSQEARIRELEELESRQSKLLHSLAEQVETMARAISSLRREVTLLWGTCIVSLVVALVAIAVALL
ncbi:MAG: hypothetical protein GF331_24760 [Chitinivibrionales bacterium]|nr:hypothetical protein [Chitinivibrionales bacterium]